MKLYLINFNMICGYRIKLFKPVNSLFDKIIEYNFSYLYELICR